jgi:acyl-CoA synthetase
LRSHLGAEGVTREWWPERLIVLDELPRASGGKVAKAELRKHCMTAAATTTGRNSARTDR